MTEGNEFCVVFYSFKFVANVPKSCMLASKISQDLSKVTVAPFGKNASYNLCENVLFLYFSSSLRRSWNLAFNVACNVCNDLEKSNLQSIKHQMTVLTSNPVLLHSIFMDDRSLLRFCILNL